MGFWRDSASPRAQQDLDGLLNVALGFAEQQLASHGEFFPYAAAIRADGAAEMIAARPDPDDEHPRSADVIASCIAGLVSRRDDIRAGAIVSDVRLVEAGGDAIQVDLEHVEGHALTVLLPYAKKRLRKAVRYGPMRAETGHRRIWA